MSSNSPSFGAAFRFAWHALTQRFGLLAAILLTMVAAWIVLEAVVIGGQRFGIVLWAAAHGAFLIFFAGLEAGLLGVCLDLCDGRAPTFASAFTRLGLGPLFLAGQLIYLLAIVVGLVLLVAPGLYVAGRFALFSFRLVDGERNLIGSFRQSATLSAGATAQLAGLVVLLLLLNAVGASLLGLGLFVTVPWSVLVMAGIYRQLANRL